MSFHFNLVIISQVCTWTFHTLHGYIWNRVVGFPGYSVVPRGLEVGIEMGHPFTYFEVLGAAAACI